MLETKFQTYLTLELLASAASEPLTRNILSLKSERWDSFVHIVQQGHFKKVFLNNNLSFLSYKKKKLSRE